jgi:multiple sugar transport system substrate-binding protein
MAILKGIAWNHTRGFVSVVACAQRFEELHPEVSIIWEKRSLQAFADASITDLAADYDLIVMDHPHTALAATQDLLLPYEDWLSPDFLADQAKNSVGKSHESYQFMGKQWTLATDAATPIATWRPDLMRKHDLPLPETWEDVLELARGGFVTVSAFPIDLLMLAYTFCAAHGHQPFTGDHGIAPDDVLASALAELYHLISLCDPDCFSRNPIRTAEWMSQTSDARAAYCPFAYGYSNYSRSGYAPFLLKAGGLVTFNGSRLRSTLGGAGIAVSSKTQHPLPCMDFARFTAAPETQKGIYFQSGGQPGHRAAWTDETVNAACHDFFRNTLQTLDESLLRPQFPGYMNFQDAASPVAHACVKGDIKPVSAAAKINRIYLDLLTRHNP